jgi:dTDP-4-dehydrorhamnose 3,5-epimerase
VKVVHAALDGVQVIETRRFRDERGWFSELWNEERYAAIGLPAHFAQDNVSYSVHGVLRGLHYQSPNEQGKLVVVLHGAVFDVAVDVRDGSPTFGRWYGHELSAENALQLWIPEGFAHGFLVLSDTALVHYGCTVVYDAAADRSLAWDDPDIGIAWPAQPLQVSDRDRAAPRLKDIAPVRLAAPPRA